MSRDMKTSSADGGRKRWPAWYAPGGRTDRIPDRVRGHRGRAPGTRPARRHRPLIAVLVIAALALAACGGGDSEELQPIDRARLSSQLNEVRAAAARRDRSAAR